MTCIPQAIKRLHADPRRVAIGKISMGGFGAYSIARLRAIRASRISRVRCCVAAIPTASAS